MPKVKIETSLASVEIEANEASAAALGEQALDLLARTLAALPARGQFGFSTTGADTDRRGTYDAPRPIDVGGMQ